MLTEWKINWRKSDAKRRTDFTCGTIYWQNLDILRKLIFKVKYFRFLRLKLLEICFIIKIKFDCRSEHWARRVHASRRLTCPLGGGGKARGQPQPSAGFGPEPVRAQDGVQNDPTSTEMYYKHGRRVCKAHLGTCLGENNWGALFEAPRGTAKS